MFNLKLTTMKPVKFTEKELDVIYSVISTQYWQLKAFKGKAPLKGKMNRILKKIYTHKEERMIEVIPTSNELTF